MKTCRRDLGFLEKSAVLLLSVIPGFVVQAQQSTAVINGETWTLRSEVVSSGRATGGIGNTTFEIIPQTAAHPFAGISSAGTFTLVSGGTAAFTDDRLDDYSIWARFEFGNPSLGAAQPAADADRDGISNEFEWISLTDPEDASSRLRVDVSLLSPTQIRVTLEPYFPAQRNYSLLRSTGLSSFAAFATDLGTASGNPPRATQDVLRNPGETAGFIKAAVEVKP